MKEIFETFMKNRKPFSCHENEESEKFIHDDFRVYECFVV